MKWLETLALAAVAVFAPVHKVLAVVLCLAIIDIVTGMIAAVKRGEKLTSSGIKRSVGKIMLYEIGVLVSFLVQEYLTKDIFPASNLMTAIIGMVELKSISENLDTISGTNTFKALIDKIVQSQESIKK